MGHICRKLPAQLFRLFFFRHVKHQQDNARDQALRKNRARVQLVGFAVHVKKQLSVFSAPGLLKKLPYLQSVVDGQKIFACTGMVCPKKPHGGRIDA